MEDYSQMRMKIYVFKKIEEIGMITETLIS